MLIACRIKPPSRGLMVTSGQHHRARRIEMPDKMGHRRRPTQQGSAMANMHSAIEAGSEVKKCSLAVIGKVSAPASRIQEIGTS
ncbi:hypothetical protein [Vreelandella rituensis]|uniref:hypothetical protein n=1 Tax=Vreelandella rituensis TaxID=2282306 RepID=UPI0011C025C3|nr:hypothetical protein [Halomonas rituensis]